MIYFESSVAGVPMQAKTCPHCLVRKLLTEFRHHAGKRDGRSSWCKLCDSQRDKLLQQHPIRRLKNRDNSRRYRALGLKRETELRHVKRYQAKYPERKKAGMAVTHAVQAGRLIRPNICSNCLRVPERGVVQAHHYDGYDKPLVVQWLCVQCHADVYRSRRATGGTAMTLRLGRRPRR